jgi:GxxExxY protein
VCLASEFDRGAIKYARQLALPVTYKGARIDCGYRVDFLVEVQLVVELKAVERITPRSRGSGADVSEVAESETGAVA